MRAVFKGFIAATLIAGSSIAATAPAEARFHHDNGGTALLAGVIGLGVGAAIASDANHYDRGGAYYDEGYAPGYYAPGYYAPAPVAYYGGDYGYDYGYGYRGDYGRGYRRESFDRGNHDRDRRDDRRGRDERHDHDREDRR